MSEKSSERFRRWSDAMLRDGVFAPLRDPAAFAQVRVHPELGTVVWPGGADLDPAVLCAALTGTEIALAIESAPGSA